MRGNGVGANGIEAGIAVAEIAFCAEQSAVEVELIGGVEANLDGGLRFGMQGAEVDAAANPEMWIGGAGIPDGVGLPASFVQLLRGPARVVARVPDTLLRRDFDYRLRNECAREKKRQERD